MRDEHRSTELFTTDNYRVTTSPAEEWDTVTRSHEGVPQAKEPGSRCIPNLQQLLSVEDARQPEHGHSGAPTTRLREEEIIAIVLYTGPMVWSRVRRRPASKAPFAPRLGPRRYRGSSVALACRVRRRPARACGREAFAGWDLAPLQMLAVAPAGKGIRTREAFTRTPAPVVLRGRAMLGHVTMHIRTRGGALTGRRGGCSGAVPGVQRGAAAVPGGRVPGAAAGGAPLCDHDSLPCVRRDQGALSII